MNWEAGYSTFVILRKSVFSRKNLCSPFTAKNRVRLFLNTKDWQYYKTAAKLFSGRTLSGLLTDREGAKRLPLKSVTHVLQRRNLAQLCLTGKKFKKHISYVTHPLSSADILWKSSTFVTLKIQDIDCILIYNF